MTIVATISGGQVKRSGSQEEQCLGPSSIQGELHNPLLFDELAGGGCAGNNQLCVRLNGNVLRYLS